MPALLGDLCWREYMTIITTTSPHGLNAGDIVRVSSMVPDRRWWTRLWSWLLRRPPPMRTVWKTFRVSEMGWTWVAGDKE